MPRTREEILQERRQLREEFGDLYDSTVALFFRHDPVGINFELNTDEYSPEAGTVLPRLCSCRSADDTLEIVYEEFARWFAASAGPKERYAQIAADLWDLWQAKRNPK